MAMYGVIYNKFPAIAAKWPVILHNVVVQTTDIIQQLAYENAPKRTEFMASNIYKVTSDGSTYGQGLPPPTDDVYLLPPGPPVTDKFTGYVGCAANYSAFVELGTRHAPSQPFFYPAMEEGRSRFEAALAAMESFL